MAQKQTIQLQQERKIHNEWLTCQICEKKSVINRYVYNCNRITNLGTVPARRWSYSVACLRALAKALKVASIMWWEFLPASCFKQNEEKE